MAVPVGATTNEEPDLGVTEEYIHIDQYVIFDLCANGGCESCARRYIPLEEYLDYTNKYHSVHFMEYCHKCHEMCYGTVSVGGGGSFWDQKSPTFSDACSDKVWDNPYAVSDCSVCTSECDSTETLSDNNSMIDALNYIKCWPIHVVEETGKFLYAGPTCNGEDSISIGLFADKDCKYYLPTLDVDDYLGGYQIFNSVIAKTHTKNPLPCHDMSSSLGMVPSTSSHDNNLKYSDFDLIAAHRMCDYLDKNAARCGDILNSQGGGVLQPRSGNNVVSAGNIDLNDRLCIETDNGGKNTATNNALSSSATATSRLESFVHFVFLLQVLPLLWFCFL